MKYSFVVLETKIINGSICVFGGLVPVGYQSSVGTMINFRWYELSPTVLPEKERTTE